MQTFLKLFIVALFLGVYYISPAQTGSGCPDDLMPKLSENKNWGYSDLFGQWVIEPIYSKVSPFKEGKAVVQRGVLCGIIDCEGNVILQCNYEKLTNFRNGKVWAMEKGLWGLIGAKGQLFQSPLYSEINPIVNSELAWVKKNNQWGLFNEDRNTFICAPQFDMAQTMSINASLVKKGELYGVLNHVNCGYLLPLELTRVKKIAPHDIIFEQKKQWGAFNELGKIILNAEYDSIFMKNDNLLQVKKENKYGLFTIRGKKILPVEYESIGEYSEGYIDIQLKGKFGYCNQLGKIYIKPIYDKVLPFQNKKAIVQKASKWGVIDITNKIVFAFEHDKIEAGNGKYFIVTTNGKSFFYSTTFKKITEEAYTEIISTDTVNAVRVKKDSLYQYFNPIAGSYVNPDKFDFAGAYSNGYAVVGNKNKKGLLDVNGKLIVPIQYENIIVDKFQNKLIFRTKLNGKEGISDSNGMVIVPNEYEKILPALPNYLKVVKDGKYGILKTTGEKVTESIYDYMSTVSNLPDAPEWPAIVSLKGKFGLISEKAEEVYPIKSKELTHIGNKTYATKEGKELLLINSFGKATAIKYDEITYFGDGLAAVKKGDKWGYINTSFEEKVKLQFEQADVYYTKMAAVKIKGKWGIIDRSGKFVIPAEYDDYKVDKFGERILFKGEKYFLLLPNGTLQ